MDLYQWLTKEADVYTPLREHQQRVVDKLQRGNLLVAHGMGSGKCVRGETPVVVDGRIVDIGSLFSGVTLDPGRDLWIDADGRTTISYRAGEMAVAPIRNLYCQCLTDDESTIRIKTKLDSFIECTRREPFLTVTDQGVDWRMAGELKIGDWVAVAPTIMRAIEAVEKSADSGLHFEPIASLEDGQRGGMVYDFEIDTDTYDDKNFVAGIGGFICHNTLSSIAAADALGLPTDVIVPAPLVGNYQKEVAKHTQNTMGNLASVRSIAKTVRDDQPITPGGLMVVDEAHMARNAGTGRQQYLQQQAPRAGRIMLLTGTPSYNDVSDIAQLMNIVHQGKVLPSNKSEFYQQFVEKRPVRPGLWGRLWGVKPGVEYRLQNQHALERLLKGHVDVYSKQEGMPSKTEQDIKVEMTPKQQEMYRFVEGDMPWWLRYKIRKNLPPSKTEARELNAFLSGVRQVSNTPGAFMKDTTPLERVALSGKLTRAIQEIKERKQKDPNFRGFVYSNFKESGVEPMSAALNEMGIPNAIIHGGLNSRQKQELADRYNNGEIPVLLGTSAATEGLDLKGTKLVQILEPHFNNNKIEQAIGRGVRYKSHAHLPQAEQNVLVQRFYSTPRKGIFSWLTGTDTAADEWVKGRADDKDHLMNQLRVIMEKVT